MNLIQSIQLYMVLTKLEVYIKENPLEPNGICDNAYDISRGNALLCSHRVPKSLFVSRLYNVFKACSEVSASKVFPIHTSKVLSPDEEYDRAYYNKTMWSTRTKYGKARRRLLAYSQEYLLNQIRQENEMIAMSLDLWSHAIRIRYDIVRPESMGICEEFGSLIGLRHIWIIQSLVSHVAKDWEHYSGHDNYPVSTDGKAKYDTVFTLFWESKNPWSRGTRYGKRRRELLKTIENYLEHKLLGCIEQPTQIYTYSMVGY